jgi:polyisoprenoid-binding protein YceI
MKTSQVKFFLVVLTAVVALSFKNQVPYRTLMINNAESSIDWSGKTKKGEHSGNMAIKSANITFQGADITGGSILIDMKSVTVTDIKAKDPDNEKLVKHMIGAEFFRSEQFPDARLDVSRVVKKSDGLFDVSAHLTLAGKTLALPFEMRVTSADDKMISETTLTIDCAKWGVTHQPTEMGKDFVDNVIVLRMKLSANSR